MSAPQSLCNDRRLLDKQLVTDFPTRLPALFDTVVHAKMSITPGRERFLPAIESGQV